MKPETTSLYSQARINVIRHIILECFNLETFNIDWEHEVFRAYGLEKGDPDYYVKVDGERYQDGDKYKVSTLHSPN